MTIKDVKEEYKNKYVELEVYEAMSGGKYYPSNFHTDNCRSLGEDSPYGNYDDDMEVGLYELMDEEEYNNTIMANCDIYADFEDWYGDKDAKVLCLSLVHI